MKCVTLDGDIHDPKGTLTGGYADVRNMILPRYFEYRKILKGMDDLHYRLEIVQNEFYQMQEQKKFQDGLREDLEKKKYKFE